MTFDNRDWILEIQNGIKSIDRLSRYLTFLSEKEKEQLEHIIREHPMLLTEHYLSLINPEDPDDPLLKMMVPSVNEFDLTGDYDTSGERSNTIVQGMQHKYAETVLVLTTNICAGYCRYCFRKRLVGLPNEEVLANFDNVIEYIAGHPEINNVLLSGGDPFVLKTETLANLIEKLDKLDQLDFIRIGTKTPIVLPQRILEDSTLPNLLKHYSKPDRRIFIITQFNHPREVNETSVKCIDTLIRANCIISNQTTLLRGVNDSPDVLAELMTKLTGIGILPYYVFQCRPVKRVMQHFQLPLLEGIDIVESAKAKMNGHGKRFKYAMSHKTGKIEILGRQGDEVFFKYHQAKEAQNIGKLFSRRLDPHQGWLEDTILPPA